MYAIWFTCNGLRKKKLVLVHDQLAARLGTRWRLFLKSSSLMSSFVQLLDLVEIVQSDLDMKQLAVSMKLSIWWLVSHHCMTKFTDPTVTNQAGLVTTALGWWLQLWREMFSVSLGALNSPSCWFSFRFRWGSWVLGGHSFTSRQFCLSSSWLLGAMGTSNKNCLHSFVVWILLRFFLICHLILFGKDCLSYCCSDSVIPFASLMNV